MCTINITCKYIHCNIDCSIIAVVTLCFNQLKLAVLSAVACLAVDLVFQCIEFRVH